MFIVWHEFKEERALPSRNLQLSEVYKMTVKQWCCQKGDPFQGPRVGSCLTLENELSEEAYVLTKQKTLLGRGAWEESRRVREPRRTALPRGLQSHGLWWWG